MSEKSKWRIYDLGRNGHVPPDQQRYFFARTVENPDDEHIYVYEVARRIVEWKNSWEDLIRELSLRLSRPLRLP